MNLQEFISQNPWIFMVGPGLYLISLLGIVVVFLRGVRWAVRRGMSEGISEGIVLGVQRSLELLEKRKTKITIEKEETK